MVFFLPAVSCKPYLSVRFFVQLLRSRRIPTSPCSCQFRPISLIPLIRPKKIMLPRPSLLKSDRSSVANIESPSYQTTHAFQMSCPSQVPGTSREINERRPFLRHFPGTALKNGQPVRDTKLLSGILLF